MSMLSKNDPQMNNSLAGRAMREVLNDGPPEEFVDILASADRALDIEMGASWEVIVTAAAVHGGIEFDTTDPETGEPDDTALEDALNVILDASNMDHCLMDEAIRQAHQMIDKAAKGKMA